MVCHKGIKQNLANNEHNNICTLLITQFNSHRPLISMEFITINICG